MPRLENFGPGPGGASAPAEIFGPGPGGAMAPARISGPGPGGAMAPGEFFGPGPGGAMAPPGPAPALPGRRRGRPRAPADPGFFFFYRAFKKLTGYYVLLYQNA